MNWKIWWEREGSAMRPLEGEDIEEFARRITEIAWSNGEFVARGCSSLCHYLEPCLLTDSGECDARSQE